MDSSIGFDPSTAKPASFDPGSAKISQATRGVGPVSERAQAIRETIVGPGVSQKQAFENQEDIEKRLRASGLSDAQIEQNPEWQASARAVNRSSMAAQSQTAIGAAGGDLLGAAGGDLLGAAVGPVISKAAPVLAKILPGATARAEKTISALGPSLDKDTIGSSLLKTLRPDYDALHATRSAALRKIANEMPEGPEKTAAYRAVFQDPKFALLKKFEESPLGSRAVATTTRYSEVPKVNPKTFIDQAFRTPQDVRDLKVLLGGDQAATEAVARKYAASELKDIMESARTGSITEANPFKSEAGNIANALERWRLNNADWLKEVPETRKAANDFIDNMIQVAKTQKHFKYATAAAGTLGLFAGGEHPFSWLRSLFGGVE